MNLNRRTFIAQCLLAGLSVPATALLLAACQNDSDDGTPDTVASTPGSVAPTQPAVPTGTEQPAATFAPTETATPDAAPDSDHGEISIAVTTAPTAIGHPLTQGANAQIAAYVFSRLVTTADDGSIRPELAQQWSYSPDWRVLTFSLVEALWHDGAPFSADDVIYTLDVVRADPTATSKAALLRAPGGALSWDKVDDRTMSITTPAPFASLLARLAEVPIIPRHILAAADDSTVASFSSNPIGTGRYTMRQWEPDGGVLLEANQAYFDGPPLNSGLRYRNFPSTDSAARAFDAGAVDAMYLPPSMHHLYRDRESVTLHEYPFFTPITLAFHHQHPALRDLDVRRAIAHALDRQALVDAATGGVATVAHHQFPSGDLLDRFNEYDQVTAISFDPDEAALILDNAGYTFGTDGIRVSATGQRLALRLVTQAGFDEYMRCLELIQDMLLAVGIEIEPQLVDSVSLRRMWSSPNQSPEARALELQEWPHPLENDPDLYDELHSDNIPPGDNYMWFTDSQSDDLIERGRTTMDDSERVALYRALDVRRSVTLPSLPLYNAVDGWIVSDRVSNVADSPNFRRYALTNAQDWTKD